METEHTNSYDHVLKYTGIFGGVQGLNILISLVRNKLVALLLGPSGMGLAALFQTTVNFISQATNLGISFSAVRNLSELFDSGDEARIAHFIKVVRAWSLLTGLAGMLVCMLAGPLLSSTTFSWGDHTLHFVLLSPLVCLLAITGGETAILKAARQLRALAAIQIYLILASLFISVPLYYLFGESAIVPVMVLTGFVSMLFTIRHSWRLYPFCLSGEKGILGEGMGMVRVGVAFTLAGILGSGSDFVIRSYLNNVADLEAVGLFNIGFMMTMTYSGLIFSAMETDYFPRLSAVNHQREKYNELINKQIEVTLLLIAPLVVMALVGLPVIIPILFSNQFLPVVGMMRIAALSLLFRAVNLPIEYLSLAKGSSSSYLLLEFLCDIFVTALVIGGYNSYGLDGTGYALLMTAILNSLMVLSYMRWKFSVVIQRSVGKIFSLHLSVSLFAFYITTTYSGWVYWLFGIALSMASLGVSIFILKQKSHLWDKLKAKILNRNHHGG